MIVQAALKKEEMKSIEDVPFNMGTSIDSQVMSTIAFFFPILFFCTRCTYTCLDCETLGVYCCLLLFTAVSKFYWNSIEEYLYLIDPLSIIVNAFDVN